MTRITDIRVADVLERDVVTIPPSASIADAIDTLQGSGITGAPVVDEQGALVGVVSQTDIIRLARDMEHVPEAMRWGMSLADPVGATEFVADAAPGEFFAYYVTPSGGFVDVRDQIRELPADAFEGYRVEDVMTPAPFTVAPDTSLPALARLLRDRSVHRALVAEDGYLVGIVTRTDIVEAVGRS